MTETVAVLPEDLEPTCRGFLPGRAGVPLAFARWEHPAPRGRVVLAHGYGEHGERYRHVAAWLHRKGWSVTTLDHQGFGRSGGPRGDAAGIRGTVEDLALVLRQERHHDASSKGLAARMENGVPLPPLPVWPQVLLGHSFGGLVALLTLLWHADTLDGLILTSPAVALRPIPWPLRMLQRGFLLAAPHRPLHVPSDKSRVCSDPVLLQRYQRDPLCHRFMSAAFLAAMEEGAREILPMGAELDRPMLLLSSSADTVVDPDGAEPLWSAVRPGLLERHRLDGFYHEVFHDRLRPRAEALTEAWLDRVFPAQPGTPAAAGHTLN